MRIAWVLGVLVAARVASASPDGPAKGPIRVTVECENPGRTKVCPAFLTGFVDANKVLLAAPRSAAEVLVYATAQEVALVDRVHLRFVGKLTGAPPLVEIDVDVDTRADDDTQRAQLEPAFLRGMALFVASRFPKAVTVALAAPDDTVVKKPSVSPYSVALSLGGFGSYTENFQNYNGFANIGLSRLEKKQRASLNFTGSGGLSRQPPIVTDDGSTVSLDTSQWSVAANADAVYLLCDCYSIGGAARVWRDDPHGQFRHGWNVRFGGEWDRYKADDPRGNRLAVLYAVGFQDEAYNLENVLGERSAHYLFHALVATASVRHDKVNIGLSLSMFAMMFDPGRRHNVSTSPFVEIQLGTHVDVGVSFSVTKRELPGPNLDLVPTDDFQTRSRLQYAEPLALNGSLNVTIHFDRTNGARNDRLGDL